MSKRIGRQMWRRVALEFRFEVATMNAGKRYDRRFAPWRVVMDEVVDRLKSFKRIGLQLAFGHVGPMTFERRKSA